MELIYLTDPMCSWCWGFAATLDRLSEALLPSVELRYVLGGLAPDSDDPMPDATRRMVQNAWGAVAATTGAEFNHDFWTECEPRRSTYPSCRAVLAAESLQPGLGPRMVRGIQHAYYLEARNPSNLDTLVGVATSLGLDPAQFLESIQSPAVEAELQKHIAERAHLGGTADAAGFPSLILRDGQRDVALTRGYAPWEELEPSLREAGVLRENG